MSDSFWKGKRVVITGGSGFLGSNLVKHLKKKGVKKIIIPRSKDIDLRYLKSAKKITKNAQIVFHLAGNVGGIGYNQQYPGTLFYDNLMMGVNTIEACRQNLVGKLIIVGTICSYPKHTPVPFSEKELWNGFPEETNAPYGIAKKSLIVMSQAYRDQYGLNSINLLPVNLYGPGDNFDPQSSHVIPALIKRFVEAIKTKKDSVTVWGTGNATREFLYVDDASRGLIAGAESYNSSNPLNIGAGFEISIKELVDLIQKLTGFKGKVVWDTSKPDGQPRRMLDTSKSLELINFQAKTSFEEGLKNTLEWYTKISEAGK